MKIEKSKGIEVARQVLEDGSYVFTVPARDLYRTNKEKGYRQLGHRLFLFIGFYMGFDVACEINEQLATKPVNLRLNSFYYGRAVESYVVMDQNGGSEKLIVERVKSN